VLWGLIGLQGLLIVLAAGVFRAAPVMPAGSELSVARSVFVAINVCTLTGFRTSVGSHDLLPLGRAVVMGFTLVSLLNYLAVGALALNRVTRAGMCEKRLLLATVGTVALGLLLGSVVLMAGGRDGIESVGLSILAVSNSAAGVDGVPSNFLTQLIVLPLMTLGGMGVVVLLQTLDALCGRAKLASATKAAWVTTAGAYGVGVMLFVLSYGLSETGQGVRAMLVSASGAAVNLRDAGWPIERVDAWPRAVQGAAIVLMTTGTWAGGTGVGVGLATIVVLVRGATNARAGKTVDRRVGIALTWLGVYVGLVITTTLLLLALEPSTPFDRVLFLSTAAVSNVGLSHDAVAFTGAGTWVLAAAMLLGRVVPLVLLARAATMRSDDTSAW